MPPGYAGAVGIRDGVEGTAKRIQWTPLQMRLILQRRVREVGEVRVAATVQGLDLG